ncbi:E3 SUMO-protein ligase PIAS2 [Orchesella cincta]|uniref:E3 SUMO-protein ligase PIAS2 n=1 Tax=Orchesella cincta TaxID=48709 RepID=A0A1D2ME25_ORCCI|nr:E3 SUMO-protein ligase PIAS2 [Orchesella cincta]
MESNRILLPSEELFNKLTREIEYPSSTIAYVKKLLMTDEEEDEGICAATSIKVSLVCPLSKVRMTYPCKAKTCKHVQCFDAKQFCMLNAVKPLVKCPVCNQRVTPEDFQIDGFLIQVIWEFSNDSSVQEINLLSDGSWEPVHVKEIAPSRPAATIKNPCRCNKPQKEKKRVTFQLDSNDSSYTRFVAGLAQARRRRINNSSMIRPVAQESGTNRTDSNDHDTTEIIDLTGGRLNVAFML